MEKTKDPLRPGKYLSLEIRKPISVCSAQQTQKDKETKPTTRKGKEKRKGRLYASLINTKLLKTQGENGIRKPAWGISS